jgi:ubiquinone/menaquinone biosynthesis C-methylase UbiE
MKRQGIRFQTRMLETIRKYLWTPEKRSYLYRSIGFQECDQVVDVGCGTGAYSRVIAQSLKHSKGGRLIGIDRDRNLLKSAKRITKSAGLSNIISFKEGNVLEGIPLPDNFADKVVCQSFLWLLTKEDRSKAIKEMVRVCKPNGTVAAVEGAVETSVIYFEDNPRLNELWKKSNTSEIEGYTKLYGYDRNSGYKIPFYFKRAGLEEIKIRVFGDAELPGDSTVPLEHKLEMLRYWEFENPNKLLTKVESCKNEDEVKALVEKAEQALIAGGMSYQEIIEFNQLRKSRAEKIIANPKLLEEERSITVGNGFLTTGIKPRVTHYIRRRS